MTCCFSACGNPDPSKAAKTASAEDEAAKETTEEKNNEEDLSTNQKKAIEEAQSYLESSGFSKAGLIDQLSGEAGSNYPEEDAIFAVEYLEANGEVDWQEQAVRKAESYLDSFSFSRDGLIDQLSKENGCQFTEEEAVYAVDYLEANDLVDWNEQAVKDAESYLEFGQFSKEQLIEQLSSEYGSKFTYEQAEYAVSQVFD